MTNASPFGVGVKRIIDYKTVPFYALCTNPNQRPSQVPSTRCSGQETVAPRYWSSFTLHFSRWTRLFAPRRHQFGINATLDKMMPFDASVLINLFI